MNMEKLHKKAGCSTQQLACAPAASAVSTAFQISDDRWTGCNLPPFPRSVSPTLLLEYEERWLQKEQAITWSEALGKLALASAIYRTHNPVLLSWRTGYPVEVAWTFVDCAFASDEWLEPSNYPRLVQDIHTIQNDDLVDKTVAEVLEVFSAKSLRRFAEAWEQVFGQEVP